VRTTNGLRAILSSILYLASVFGSGQTDSNPVPTPSPAQFTDYTSHSGVTFQHFSSHTSKKYLIETMGAGVALLDYDNDGRLDIFLVNGAPIDDPSPKGSIPKKTNPKHWNRLYHQERDGTFKDMTEHAGLEGAGYGFGVAVGDYDNDGFEDLYVTAYGGNQLYHNNGDGTFTDVTVKSGTGGSGWSTSAAWVDLDSDGLLDLVVARYLQWDFDDIWCGEHKEGYRAYCHPDQFPPVTSLVYHNDGNGHFTEIAQKLNMAKAGKGLGVAIADFNGDGRPDVFIANDSVPEFLYENKGNGTFEEVGLISQAAVDAEGNTFAGMGVDFADYNNDGLPDLVVTALAYQRYALFKNMGDGTFSYISQNSGLGPMTYLHSGWGARLLDFDNDGLKDLFVVQGHVMDTVELNFPQLRYREPMLLARNIGGKFVDISRSAGAVFQQPWVARGLAIGDIDNDGKLDAVVTTNDGPAYVFRNETSTQNHWLSLKLLGHKSNRDAIGAEIKIVTRKGPQFATVTTAGSYLSSGDKRVHFGLGTESTVKTVSIRWPSGVRETLDNVRGDQILEVEEPAGKQP
jgi:hypothetical protein